MHWGIVYGLHWVLDIVFGEDESRIRDGNAAENMNTARSYRNKPVEAGKSCSMEIVGKRKTVMTWNKCFFFCWVKHWNRNHKTIIYSLTAWKLHILGVVEK